VEATPVSIIFPEVAHILGSQPEFQMLVEFNAGLAGEKAGSTGPVELVEDLVGLILQSELENDLAEVTGGGFIGGRGSGMVEDAEATR
jgi:hypothetical protein